MRSVLPILWGFSVLFERTAAMKGKNICIETLRLTYLSVRLARTVLVRFPRRIHQTTRDAYVLDTVNTSIWTLTFSSLYRNVKVSRHLGNQNIVHLQARNCPRALRNVGRKWVSGDCVFGGFFELRKDAHEPCSHLQWHIDDALCAAMESVSIVQAYMRQGHLLRIRLFCLSSGRAFHKRRDNSSGWGAVKKKYSRPLLDSEIDESSRSCGRLIVIGTRPGREPFNFSTLNLKERWFENKSGRWATDGGRTKRTRE